MGRASLKEIRQQEILAAFYAVAKKQGLENASLAKVADHMDINPSLIVHYFQSRELMFEGLIRFILERYNIIYKTDKNDYKSKKDLYQLIDTLFSRKWDKLFDDSVFYSCYALTYRDKKIRTAFKALHDSLRELLFDVLQKAAMNGVIKPGNTRELTEIIFALVEGAYYYLGMIDSRTEYNQKLSTLKKQTRKLLGI